MRDGASDGRHRRAPRLTTRLSGSLVGKTRLEVEILDLSLTGCLVRCPVLLDRGLILDLTLDVEGATFAAKVRVAEASRDGQSGSEGGLCLIGLEFLALPVQGEQLLRSFLQRERRRRQSEA
jgi:hypothetical protein